MSNKAHVFIEDRPYGSFQPGIDERGNDATGTSFWCPDCPRVWAIVIVSGKPTYPLSIPCRRHHRSAFFPGGSIWLPLKREYNTHYPREVLLHEFLRCLELIEEFPEEYELP